MTEARLLGGRYELGETLGYGGMAEVHRGRDVRLGREVAVKVLRADLARDPTFLGRFRREAQSAASLNHPSIVAVYDTGEDLANGSTDGAPLPYIVMEYVEGRTLRDVLHAEGPVQPERAMEIIADVCAALEYSHRAGIVHRDIKPANVMLTPDGAVKVMDFGIARAVTSSSTTMTQTAAVIGTAQYLSPEQARGEPVDARSDVYSTGCLLYELVTGSPPFTGDSPVAVAYQHVREDPVPPSSLNPDISPALDAIVLKAMAKNPANRYQSAAEMRADLVRAATGRPVLATPVLADAERTQIVAPAAATTMLRRPDPPRRRGRGFIYTLLALAVIGVFILAAVLATSLLRQEKATVRVPDVRNRLQPAAEQLLRQAGLERGNVRQVNSTKARGTVVDQDPVPGTPLKEGDQVDLEVSNGPVQVTVPQIVGKSQQEAEQLLTEAGLRLGQVSERDGSNEPAGTVIESSPPPGTNVNDNSAVNLVVSAGTVLVPDVVGRTEDSARQVLAKAGLRVRVSREVVPGAVVGTVTSQRPPPGSTLDRNQSVRIVVAKEPPPPPTTAPPTTPPPTTAPPTTAPPTTTPTVTPTPLPT